LTPYVVTNAQPSLFENVHVHVVVGHPFLQEVSFPGSSPLLLGCSANGTQLAPAVKQTSEHAAASSPRARQLMKSVAGIWGVAGSCGELLQAAPEVPWLGPSPKEPPAPL
jgi:hypothetical protein